MEAFFAVVGVMWRQENRETGVQTPAQTESRLCHFLEVGPWLVF